MIIMVVFPSEGHFMWADAMLLPSLLPSKQLYYMLSSYRLHTHTCNLHSTLNDSLTSSVYLIGCYLDYHSCIMGKTHHIVNDNVNDPAKPRMRHYVLTCIDSNSQRTIITSIICCRYM